MIEQVGIPTCDQPGLGAALRRERLNQAMSLRELSRRIGVSASLVSQIETGKLQPSVRTLYSIVNELSISIDRVFGNVFSEVSRNGSQLGSGSPSDGADGEG